MTISKEMKSQTLSQVTHHDVLPRSKTMAGTHSALSDTVWKPSPEVLKLWEARTPVETDDKELIQRNFCRHATKTLARSTHNMDNFAAYQSLAHTVIDRLLDQWNKTQLYQADRNPKRVYYMSLEFLVGRSLDNALLNLSAKDKYAQAISEIGFRMEDVIPQETDAALGNGGLGRLASCFMDSLATLDIPAWGYGIRYTYGIFQQKIIDGYQNEFPDYWLTFGNIWEIPRLDVSYDIQFRGYVTHHVDASGNTQYVWEDGEKVAAVAYDYPVPGFGTKNTNNIRLWSSKPKKEFDLASFNEGDYNKSVEEQKAADNITSVLYPNDNHMSGKILRLKQQYFFVSATLQDIIRRFKKTPRPWSEFSGQVAIQLNDTHPTLGIAELMRILMDEEHLGWDEAWAIVKSTYSYTNHTVLPEALEKWPVPLVQELLPRHMMIMFTINLYFLQAVERKYPGDREKLRRMSIIEEGNPQYIRMAFLAIVGSYCVNGVAALHSELIKTTIFSEFVEFFGDGHFTNVTNGVTPRRWLHQANPKLSDLITVTLKSDAWLKDLTQLAKLKPFAKDANFQKKWMAIKHQNKVILAEHIAETTGLIVSPDALFDIHCKRLHEYKRQFMNILGVLARYEKLKSMTEVELKKVVPHVVIFAGKSAPGYYIAKMIIKLINSAADVINGDAKTTEYLKVVFIPNYCVSLAEIMIPASDISQHISTAGTEASGTSNMKFVLNGGLILGTVDGANIEIGEEVGSENIFLFGALAHEVEDIRHEQMFRGIKMNPRLDQVIKNIENDVYGPSMIFEPLLNTLKTDYYLIDKDFQAYLDAIDLVDVKFTDKTDWAVKSITAAASMGKFSSDRSIQEYVSRIWKVKPVTVV